MQSHQRRSLLSAALQLQPGREPTRETVEAAIWAALGPTGDENRVSLLLSVIDAWSDARSRRAAANWAKISGGTEPPLGTDIAQTASVRRSLDGLACLSRAYVTGRHVDTGRLAAHVIASPARRNDVSGIHAVSASHATVVPAEDVDADSDIIDEELWQALKAEFSTPPASSTSPVPMAPAGDFAETAPARACGVNEAGEVLYSCNSCPVPQPRTGFYKSGANKYGFDYTCKRCKGDKNRDWRNRKRKEAAERAAAIADDTAENMDASLPGTSS